MPELIHDEAVVNDVRLHYVEAGNGPLVVLLHGFPEFWYSWREQIPALADAGFHVVAPDMRGYDASEKPHGIERYESDELVGDVLGLIDHFGAETTHVVGHDWGGLVAWQTAIRHPERVEKLVVLNAPHPGRFLEVLPASSQLVRSWYLFFFQLPRLPEYALSANNYAVVEKLLRFSATETTFSEEDVQRYVEAIAQPGALTATLNYYRAVFRENAKEELETLLGRPSRDLAVHVPTLLIWGEQDIALEPELIEGMHRWVPDLRIERLSDATHWVQNDEPTQVNELLLEYLQE